MFGSHGVDQQDQAEAALAREQAEWEAKVQAAEARQKAVEEQNNLLHAQLASSAGQPNGEEGDQLSVTALKAFSAQC